MVLLSTHIHPEMEPQKFALLLCCEDTDYIKRSYGGYYGVFTNMLKEEGETWDLYNVSKHDFPADSELGEYDGFVISGSCSDAHGNDLWILELVNLLMKLVVLKKRILGICFGHQVLIYTCVLITPTVYIKLLLCI